jgi:hypothetical protein
MWGAGSTIDEVQAYLCKRGESLSSHPSAGSITLGGWIASGSHGSGGTLWVPSFDKIRVRDRETGRVFVCQHSELFGKERSIEECRRYLILEVHLTPTDNVWCRKSTFKMNSLDDAHRFLAEETYLRLIQVGRRGIHCLVWTRLTPEESGSITHVDPHIGSQLGLWFQSDFLSIHQCSRARDEEWFDWPVEKPEKYTSKVRLRDANMYSVPPSTFTSLLGLKYKNFEVFVFEYALDGEVLWTLCNAFSDVFTTELRGRCEVRCGKSIVFLDFVVFDLRKVEVLFSVILRVLGPVRIGLHRGKAQVSTYPFGVTDQRSGS